MVGGGWRVAVVAWWRAPSTLEVLVGPEQYGPALGHAWTRLALLGMPVGLTAILIEGSFGATALGATAIMFAVLTLCVTLFRRVGTLPRGVVLVALLTGATLLGIWIPLLGPRAGESAALVPMAAAMSSLWMRRRWALLATAAGAASYAVALAIQDLPNPVPRWIVVVGLAVLIIIELSWVLDRVHALADQEREATEEAARLATSEREARTELAELNRTLEERVESQVGEIEGLGRLRQFLSPAVADAVVADSLAPHRRRIAVVFSDLRGFTTFSTGAEPEELLDVLDAYYEVVGAELRTYGATVGSFQGDGILAYFNDPVPCDDPAGTAVAMALALRSGLDQLAERWSRRGFGLGWGIGIAYGYATLGTIGFDDRRDYTPLGAVVNLASRLCDEAAPGEVLLDGRTHHEVDGKVPSEQLRVQLKGYDAPIVAYRLTRDA